MFGIIRIKDTIRHSIFVCVFVDGIFIVEMDVGVIGSHVARQTAELTMQGEFTKARVKSLSAQKMLHEQRYGMWKHRF